SLHQQPEGKPDQEAHQGKRQDDAQHGENRSDEHDNQEPQHGQQSGFANDITSALQAFHDPLPAKVKAKSPIQVAFDTNEIEPAGLFAAKALFFDDSGKKCPAASVLSQQGPVSVSYSAARGILG